MKDYKKILEGVVNIINTTEKSDIGFANICTYIGENCPELVESEDERIRKKLITYFQDLKGGWFENITNDDIITWLKKQGKSKWTDEDEKNLRDIISAIHYISYQTAEAEIERTDWIKSLKQRMEE